MSGRRLWRGIIVALVAIGVIVVAGVVWIAGGPGPMDFAGGRKVALADYRAANPTGVPAELAQADPVKRGLVTEPDQWAWSSFRAYMYGEAGPYE